MVIIVLLMSLSSPWQLEWPMFHRTREHAFVWTVRCTTCLMTITPCTNVTCNIGTLWCRRSGDVFAPRTGQTVNVLTSIQYFGAIFGPTRSKTGLRRLYSTRLDVNSLLHELYSFFVIHLQSYTCNNINHAVITSAYRVLRFNLHNQREKWEDICLRYTTMTPPGLTEKCSIYRIEAYTKCVMTRTIPCLV